MNSQTRREIRFGLSALVLTGLLFTLGVAIRGPLDRDPVSLMRGALSPNFVPGAAIGLVGGVIQIYGLVGLYRYLTYAHESLIALLAISSVAGIALVLPLVTFLAVDAPVIAQLYQQGNQAVIAVVESNFTGFGLALLGVGSVAGSIGTILFGVAIWRHRSLPRWLGPVYALKGLLLAISGPGLFATELLGAVLTLVCACVLAWSGWQESAPEKTAIGTPHPSVPAP
jgi:hypothetical protein